MPAAILAAKKPPPPPTKPAKTHLTEQLQVLQQNKPAVQPQVWLILTKTVQLTVELDDQYLTWFWRLQTLSSSSARQVLVERTTNPELVKFFQQDLPQLLSQDATYLIEAAALWHALKTKLTAQLNCPTLLNSELSKK